MGGVFVLVLALACCVCGLVVAQPASAALADNANLAKARGPGGWQWEGFKSAYNKTYLSAAHEAKHLRAYLDNVAYIARRNREQSSFRLGVNHLADLDRELYRALLSPASFQGPGGAAVRRFDAEAVSRAKDATAVDWRTKKAVTDVKNQGQCGSCWSFATVGSVEGAYAIATGALRSFSEQELVDCSTVNHGCGGGNLDLAMQFVAANHGIDGEADYPYQAVQGACDPQRSLRFEGRIAGYQDVEPKNADQMLAAVAQGPVAVAIEADQRDFQLYKSGVFDGACGQKLDHGVLVVGYTAEAWIVKNSWSATWGEKGFIYLKRFGPTREHPAGQCGVLSTPTYAVVNDTAPLPLPPPTPGPKPGLKCECAASCEKMCNQFGMKCCSGKGGNCNCQPARDTCCDKSEDAETSSVHALLHALEAQDAKE